MMQKTIKYIALSMLCIIIFDACEDEPLSKNPPIGTDDGSGRPPIISDYENDSFIGLHANFLQNTCANSGCHDGSFPPDFRTIESSYNTLVNQPIVKNNPAGEFEVRVLPGNAEKSVLYHRLITDIDGQSGIMPLVVDEDVSDYNEKREQYIENVRNWINNGALDIFGNPPGTDNAPPGFLGLVAYDTENNIKLPRIASTGIILIPFDVNNVTFYFAFSDDDTAPQNFRVNKIKLLANTTNFETGNPEVLGMQKGETLRDLGFTRDSVDFTHSFSLDVSNYPDLTPYFIQTLVQDSRQDTSKIPNAKSAQYIFDYFSFRKQP